MTVEMKARIYFFKWKVLFEKESQGDWLCESSPTGETLQATRYSVVISMTNVLSYIPYFYDFRPSQLRLAISRTLGQTIPISIVVFH